LNKTIHSIIIQIQQSLYFGVNKFIVVIK
jgi:hypothetical protein